MIDFAGTSNPVETQYQVIKDILYQGVCEVEFTKVSGELRVMKCTLHKDWMPSEAIREHHQTRLLDLETIPVFDTDKQEWRSFKTMRVITVKLINHGTETLDSNP